MKRIITTIAIAASAVLTTAVPALAHITAAPDKTGAGEYSFVRFGVGHGCDDAGTTSVAIKIPQEDFVFSAVTPYVNPGWDVEVKEGKLKEAVELHGSEVTEGVSEVVYTKKGASLPADRGDALFLTIRLPEDAAGETIYFPVVQSCEGGKENAWIQIPAEGEDAHSLESPAAMITVTDAAGGHGGGHGDDAMSKDDSGSGDDGDDEGDGDDEEEAIADPGLALGIGILALVMAAFALFVGMRNRK